MKYFLLKEIVAYLSTNAQNIKIIKRIDNNIIIIEFNNKNNLYFDMSKGNSTIFKCEKSISSKRDFNAPFDIALQKRFINSKYLKKTWRLSVFVADAKISALLC